MINNRFSMLHSSRRFTISALSTLLFAYALSGSVNAETIAAQKKTATDLADIVLMKAQAGKAEQLGKAIRELLVHSRTEPGCVIAELHQSVDDPNTWMVYERWRNKDALDTHMKQPYVATFLKQLAELSSEPADVRSYEHRP